MFDSTLTSNARSAIMPPMGRTRVRWARVIAAGAVAGTMAVGSARLAAASSGGARAAQRIYVVRPGDTLWRIAVRLSGDGDPREVVDRLAASNHIGNSLIRPGERLLASP